MDIILLDRENNILDQLSAKDTLSLTTEEGINSVGKGAIGFSIEKSNELYGNLFVRNRVLLREDNKILFGGEFYGIKPTYSFVNTFYMQDLLGYFQNRIIHVEKDYSGFTITAALQDLMAHLDDYEATNIVLDCEIEDIIDDGDVYPIKTTAFAIIEDLLKTLYEYRVKPAINGLSVTFTFEVTSELGEDFTSGDSYKEYKLDTSNTKKANISSVIGDVDINYTANVVVGEQDDTFTTKTDTTSISLMGRIERGVDFSTSLEEEAEQYLEDRKEVFKGVTVVPISNNYFDVGLGDSVQITLSGNRFLELSESTRVIAKKYVFGDIPKITFTFNSTKIKKTNGLELFVEQINEIKSKISNL